MTLCVFAFLQDDELILREVNKERLEALDLAIDDLPFDLIV
jgi:hypothetical protein